MPNSTGGSTPLISPGFDGGAFGVAGVPGKKDGSPAGMRGNGGSTQGNGNDEGAQLDVALAPADAGTMAFVSLAAHAVDDRRHTRVMADNE